MIAPPPDRGLYLLFLPVVIMIAHPPDRGLYLFTWRNPSGWPAQPGINLEEPVRVASPTRINLEEPVRVASPTRINLEEPLRVASPTRN